MAKRQILTKEQRLLHKDPELYKKFVEIFPDGVNFYTLESFDNPLNENLLDEWHRQIDGLCKVYKIESADALFSVYNKDFFCLIYNKFASHLYESEKDVFMHVVKGFRTLQGCLLCKV